MKTITITSVLLMLLTSSQVHSQEKKEPRGKAIVEIYTNFHSGFGAARNDRGFELERSYIGYQYHWGHSITVKGVIDVGVSDVVDGYQNIAYIKNALISWNAGAFTLNGGLITNTQFNYQENFWGYRYMKMVLQDYYKFASSADLGLSASYKFADWISMDAIVVNGEGYKKIQKNSGLQYGIGATLTPINSLTMRLYGSINERAEKSLENINIYAAFLGYKREKFSIGAEYNRIENMSNIKNHHLDGVSIYSTIKIADKVNGFLRYDNLWSKDGWNSAKDESTYMAGVEYRPCRYVKIAPNFRYDQAKGAAIKDRCMAYINCFFGF